MRLVSQFRRRPTDEELRGAERGVSVLVADPSANRPLTTTVDAPP
jgi:hypothetical protein